MGALSINLAHLPFAGTILNQPAGLFALFDIIKAEHYHQNNEKIKADM